MLHNFIGLLSENIFPSKFNKIVIDTKNKPENISKSTKALFIM